jgi:hypothetical protein
MPLISTEIRALCLKWGSMTVLTPIGRLWILLTPSSDIKIINNPINTQRVKAETNIIKSTIIYIQSINIHIKSVIV